MLTHILYITFSKLIRAHLSFDSRNRSDSKNPKRPDLINTEFFDLNTKMDGGKSLPLWIKCEKTVKQTLNFKNFIL